jgi:hypothetical protein
LRELVRASSEPVEVASAPVDWARLIDAAERHRLAPLAFEGLRAHPMPLPSECRTRLENLRNLELAKAVVRLHHLDELGAVALQRGMDLCLLKGAAFATTLYRDPGLRPMSDIDVLAAPSDLERWTRELERLGYFLVDGSDHARCYRKRATGVLVELHFRLTSAAEFLGIDTGAILERSRPAELREGVRLRTLTWEDHLLHLSLHASFQHGFRQPGVNAWDARLIAERRELDLEAFVGRAQRKRLAPWVYGGLAMTAAVFETPRLAATLSALADFVPRSVVRKASRFQAERLLSPEQNAVSGTPFGRLSWTGLGLTTFSLLWEISRPRNSELRGGLEARLHRIFELARNHGLALVGPTSNRGPALPMGPTSASLGEVRDV